MANLNKLALVRMALRYTIKDLTREEKLCILADIFCPKRDGIRWTGQGGFGQALTRGATKCAGEPEA